MKRPEMIIFDYGSTLIYLPDNNTSNGNRALYGCIEKNPRSISFEEFDKTIIDIFARIKAARGLVLEIHEHAFLKAALEYMNIKLSVSLEEAEILIMNGISKGEAMPYADELLDYLNAEGIKTGVISNYCFSGKALQHQLDILLPSNRFEFVLVSSDYLFKKPDSFMFEIALQKAGLTADKVWYCGDSIEADMYGAKGAGIFPVLYSGKPLSQNNPFSKQNEGMIIDFDCLNIMDWQELSKIIDKLK